MFRSPFLTDALGIQSAWAIPHVAIHVLSKASYRAAYFLWMAIWATGLVTEISVVDVGGRDGLSGPLVRVRRVKCSVNDSGVGGWDSVSWPAR